MTGEEISLVSDAHAAGLKVMPYTVRDDEAFQALNPDGSVPAPADEYRKLIAAGVDGFFTDFPGTGRQVVDEIAAEVTPHQNSNGWRHGEAAQPLDMVGACDF